ncbi:MAG: hypothetical protein DRO13_05820 [Thermoprotei archaeon]|nr:MAG: hypothetical protein DRO13_05820 [Thermoprotei archaeon]
MEILAEKALHVLASIDVIDYEIIRGWTTPCKDGYPIAKSENEVFKLYLDERGGRTIYISPRDLMVATDGRGIPVSGYGKYYIVTLNSYILPWDRVVDAIRKHGYMEFSKLSSAISLARYIVNGKIEEAKKVIERYFELSMKRFEGVRAEEIMNKLIEQAKKEYINVKPLVNTIEVLIPESIRYRERSYDKHIRAVAFSYGITIAFLKHHLVPDLTLVLVPYGYAGEVRRYLREIAKSSVTPIPLDIDVYAYRVDGSSGRRVMVAKESLDNLRERLYRKDPTTVVIAVYEWHEHVIDIVKKWIGYRMLIPVVLRYI